MVKNPPANAGDTGDVSLIPGLGRSPGGGNGNPLSCLELSCLGNSMDRGAWWATVHGVTKSQTWLNPHALLYITRLLLLIGSSACLQRTMRSDLLVVTSESSALWQLSTETPGDGAGFLASGFPELLIPYPKERLCKHVSCTWIQSHSRCLQRVGARNTNLSASDHLAWLSTALQNLRHSKFEGMLMPPKVPSDQSRSPSSSFLDGSGEELRAEEILRELRKPLCILQVLADGPMAFQRITPGTNVSSTQSLPCCKPSVTLHFMLVKLGSLKWSTLALPCCLGLYYSLPCSLCSGLNSPPEILENTLLAWAQALPSAGNVLNQEIPRLPSFFTLWQESHPFGDSIYPDVLIWNCNLSLTQHPYPTPPQPTFHYILRCSILFLFIYLTVLGFNCSTWNLWLLQSKHARSLVVACRI